MSEVWGVCARESRRHLKYSPHDVRPCVLCGPDMPLSLKYVFLNCVEAQRHGCLGI